MVRKMDQETIAIEKIVCYSQFPRGEACHAIGATWGSTRVS